MNETKKPYFLPLNKEFYLKVKSGEQDCEIRPANHRGWNSKNIYPGRWLKFSAPVHWTSRTPPTTPGRNTGRCPKEPPCPIRSAPQLPPCG